MVATSEASSLDRIARSVWTPPERLDVSEWADRHRVLIRAASAEAGRWSTARTPYLREVMRAFNDPRVRVIVLMCGSQLGKTEVIANCLFYIIDMDPGPTLFVYPNDKLANSTNRDRLVPTIEATPAVAKHLTDSPQDVKGLQITLDSMNIWFTGANNATNLKSRPCRFVLEDEIDEFPPGAAATADERVKAFPDSKIIKTSTPSDAGLGIDAEYAKSDQRRFEVPCPHCGTFQELVFDQIVWDGGSEASPDQVEKTARYVCPHCGGECYEHDKPGMLDRGVWVREGQRVEKDGTVVGEALRPDSAVAGFRLSSLYSPFSSCSWGAVARRFAEDGFVLTREFVTGYLGKPWALQADKAEAKELEKLMVSVADGGYPCRTAPVESWDEGPGPLVLVGAIDVQQDSCWWAVYGFGAGGRDVFVIDFGQVLAGRGGDLVELEPLLGYEAGRDTGHGIRDTGKAGPMRPVVWALDTGHRTKECYTFCRRAGLLGKRIIPTKGRETMSTPHAVSRIDKFPDGTPMPGGLALLHVNTDHWKESIVGMIKRQADGRAAAVAGRLYLPDPTANGGQDGPILREFARQVTAEHKVVVPDRNASKRGLRPMLKSEWRLKPQHRDNHALDTLVGALAVADAMGIRTLGAKPAGPGRAQGEAIQRMPAPEPRPGRQWNRGNTQWKERMNRMRERMAARR